MAAVSADRKDHDIATRFAAVQAAIAAAAASVDRAAADISLIAVSKTYGPEAIRPLLAAGHRLFGENRVQEAQAKWPLLKNAYPDILLHLIGPLQTNKVAEAVALFDVIETVDREKLAAILAREMAQQQRPLPVFIQVNTGDEPQKAGIAPREVDDFITRCRDVHRLNVAGLMCIPPVDEEAALHFALLAKIAARHHLSHLSMGMSADYEKAIRFGATYVRVGTAIFGART
ncbi:MAG: YggS family pyridoxal phosphate-dependent enzyme [Alphaproteobacteria bacterium]